MSLKVSQIPEVQDLNNCTIFIFGFVLKEIQFSPVKVKRHFRVESFDQLAKK